MLPLCSAAAAKSEWQPQLGSLAGQHQVCEASEPPWIHCRTSEKIMPGKGLGSGEFCSVVRAEWGRRARREETGGSISVMFHCPSEWGHSSKGAPAAAGNGG